jgi:hypothetical protein
VGEVLAAASRREPPVILPHPRRVEDGVVSLYPGDAGYAETALDAPGPRNRLIMRASGWRYVREPG